MGAFSVYGKKIWHYLITKVYVLNEAYGLLCLRQEKIRKSRHGRREPSPEPWMVNATGRIFLEDLNVTTRC